jgi:hypothetical protein
MGNDCDFFYEAPDAVSVLLKFASHGPVAHKKQMLDAQKNISEGTARFSDSVLAFIPAMKNLDAKESSAACGELGTQCEDKFSNHGSAATLVQLLHHLDLKHPEEMRRFWEEKNFSFMHDVDQAIKR